MKGIILAVVGIMITVAVYGAVALIVKMDDIGLHMVRERSSSAAKALGRGLLHAMPRLLTALSAIGTLAMLWVGGHILVDGAKKLGFKPLYEAIHAVEHAVHGAAGALGGVLGWLANSALSGIVGLILGAVVAFALHKVPAMLGKSAH
jgi:predicted DNA repair protein MutK